MHRTLQDLGCTTHYLDYAETELTRILEAILSAHSVGGELFGETAEALLNKEVEIGDIRDLTSTFATRLAAEGVFSAPYNHNARRSEDEYQIDEHSFALALESEAIRRDRSYKRSNADSDARSLAIIIRLRKGQVSRRLSEAKHVFVSCNVLLQKTARMFSARTISGYAGQAIPPVLTVGQITTSAWLATAKKLEPHRVTKELLTTCYDAVQPSSQWTLEFSTALQKFRNENPGFLEERANAALFLNTVRDAARDESVNQSSVLKRINLADIFQRAAKDSDQKESDRVEQVRKLEEKHKEELSRIEDERRATERDRETRTAEEFEIALNAAKELARAETRDDARADHLASVQQLSKSLAHICCVLLEIALAVVFAILSYLVEIDFWTHEVFTRSVTAFVLALLATLSFVDALGIGFLARQMRSLEEFMQARLTSVLKRFLPEYRG